MSSACDSVMDCDAVVLLNSGSGDYTTTTQKDGQLHFSFPSDSKPATVKLTSHDMTIQPWYRQAEKGKIHLPKEVEAADGPQSVYKSYFKDAPNKMLDGQNIMITSYGDEKTRKAGLMLGDSKSQEGVLHLFIKDLFQCDGAHHHDLRLTAYAFCPTGEKVTDMIPDDGGDCLLKDADAKRAGSDLIGLQATMLKDYETAKKELTRIQEHVTALKQKEIDFVEKRSEQMGLKIARNDDEVDLGFDSADSKKKVESYMPEPFHDQMIVVTVTAYAGEKSILSERKSAQWSSATFLILPETARPEAVGALRQDDVVRYEKVQKLLCAVFAVQTAIRLKRRRIPFLAHRFTSTLRIPYRQTGEREAELKLIRNASFRSKHVQGKDGSPTASPRYTEADAPVTKSIVLLHISGNGDSIMENFHTFTCVKRFTEMQGATQGLFSRHLGIEQAQMDREIAALILQLDIAKSVHSYKPLLFGNESKKENDKSIIERENAALKKKEGIIKAAEEERDERIKTAAHHIADRNIQEEKARCAQIQQAHSDVMAKKKRLEDELHKWKTLSVDDLNTEISGLNRDLAVVEKKSTSLEQDQERLKKALEDKKKAMSNMTSALAEKQRKALAEIEKRKAEAKKVADDRKQAVSTSIKGMRDGVVKANTVVRNVADKLVTASPASKEYVDQLKQSIVGLEGILDRLMPGEPSPQQLQRVAAVKERLLKMWTHELLHMQRALREAGVPLPVNPSLNPNCNIPLDTLRPVVGVYLIFEGMTGLADDREMRFSIAASRRGVVRESPRVALSNGVVTWNYHTQFVTRLPAPTAGKTACDLLTMSVTEFLPDGSFAESLPFDIDLTALACKAPRKYVIMPCNESDLRVCFHATTRHMRPKRVKANPLMTAKQVSQHKHSDVPYGPSSDEE
eukprot:TRINITY_DN8260_c0_g1_i1.p1 TRINITY_DN8260_c0_g1~~TRINITY_DN8260_c0_g1_i1.p1  ORF type:complete len:910 (+),score=301.25 TRINITY_DN8260_c0_g1_i1:52-2781(+)